MVMDSFTHITSSSNLIRVVHLHLYPPIRCDSTLELFTRNIPQVNLAKSCIKASRGNGPPFSALYMLNGGFSHFTSEFYLLGLLCQIKKENGRFLRFSAARFKCTFPTAEASLFSFVIFTARRQSCGKVMFSQASVCQSFCP